MSENTAHVLIVDDASINRMILSSMLASYGVQSDEAENGKECIHLCKEKTYDLIFLDQNLPKTVEQALRSVPILINLCRTEHKTLCLAGESFAIERIQSQEYRDQIYAFYQRPIDTDELVADMKKLSASHDEFYRLKNILVVDDDPAFQQVVSLWLSADYNVVVQHSGADALAYLERTRPDLILLDYEMSEIDGFQVLEQIRQNPMTAQIPVIFLTGQNDKDRVMRILHQKPDGYLLKSASKEELLDTLNRFFVSSILNQKKKKKQPAVILNEPVALIFCMSSFNNM